MNQTERNFWLDGGLFLNLLSISFTGFVLWLLIPHQTAAGFLGQNRQGWSSVHVCTGLIGIAGNVIHMIWHRGWLKALRRRPLASLPAKLRSNRITNRLIWLIFLMVTVLGVLDWIIPGFENKASIFGRMHVASSIAWLFGITVHLILHRKWIRYTFRDHYKLKKVVTDNHFFDVVLRKFHKFSVDFRKPD